MTKHLTPVEKEAVEHAVDYARKSRWKDWGVAGLIAVVTLCAGPFLLLPLANRATHGDAARTSIAPPGVWLTGSAPVAYDLPSSPYPEQRRPPCGEGQKVIRGGCWRELADRPDAAGQCADSAPYDGRCWIPVHISNIPRTSIKQAQ